MNLRRWTVISLVALGACAASGGTKGAAGSGGASSTGTGTTGQGGDEVTFDGGQGGTGLDPDAACLVDSFGADAAPAFLLFQLDVSGSMNCAPNDAGCATAMPGPGSRWEVFKSKLVGALDSLPPANGAGLMHYPTGLGTFQGNPKGCVPQAPDVAVAPLSTSKPDIVAKLGAIKPAGGTPTHDAVTAALEQLDALLTPGAKYLVLATDGQATFCAGCDLFCTSDELGADNEVLVNDVANAAAQGIRTFVLGAPGSAGYRTILSRLAEAGQTQSAPGCSNDGPVYCHYDMTTSPDFGAALEAALAAIGGAALSCSYDIPKQDGQFDPTRVNVELTINGAAKEIPQDPSHMDGWDYSPDGKQILLYGSACAQAKEATNGKIDILYGCPTIVK